VRRSTLVFLGIFALLTAVVVWGWAFDFRPF
jgi:hypothetical protein